MNQTLKGILIGILIAGLLIGLFFGFNYQKNKYLNQGYQSGQLYLIQSITQTGNIPLFTNSTGNITIQQIPIKTLCKNIQGVGA